MATKRKPFEPKPETVEAQAIQEAESIERVLTVNGKPIPSEFAHAIPYAQTDQGIAEAKAKPGLRAVTSVVADAWDKALDRKAEAQPWDSYDPFTEAVDSVREPGMTYRMLSDRAHKRRGRRGWETVTDKDGKPVQVSGMTLGKMPTEAAERRNSHYREIGNEQLRTAAEAYELEQAKVIRNANIKGFAPLRTGETVTDSHDHPGMVTEVGIQSHRGQA